MSSPTSSGSLPGFSDAELDLLARTADALSAYTGKPIMAEVGATDGVAWVVFGMPLDSGDARDDAADDELVVWQMGGAGTELLGNSGGISPAPGDIYDCRLLWAIQITEVENERFIKLDADGIVVDWSDQLADLLPFGLDDEEDLEDSEEGGSDDSDDSDE